MGRSVITHREAVVVAYDEFGPNEEYYRECFNELDEDDREYYSDFETYMYRMWNEDAQFEWTDYKTGIQDMLKELFPSFEATDRGTGYYGYDDEQVVIAENYHSEVSISEYCGVVAISLAPRSDIEEWQEDWNKRQSIGKAWRNKISSKFEERFSTARKIGTFSNGESVYERKTA
jgi:hypothetical protein